MNGGPQAPAAALVVSDVFPPAIGGSGELLYNVYRRWTGLPITVLAGMLARTPSASEDGVLRVVRDTPPNPPWGLLSPAGLRLHLRQASRLRRACAQGATVVHCSRLLPEGVSAWLASRVARVPYICWAHGEELSYAASSRELSFLATRVQLSAAAIIANSQNTAGLLRSAGVASEAIEVVHPGVDAARFEQAGAGVSALRRSLADDADVVLLTVGRLQRRKGHDLVLQALAEVPSRESFSQQRTPGSSRLRYVIVGDGEDRSRLERMAAELGVSDRVRFAGAVPADALPRYYAAADVFVHPNRVDGRDVEGFGIVFLEAAAAGLPVIGGDSGGVPEAVGRDEGGVLVSGTDVSELRQAIERLAASADLRRRIGEAGRARVRRDFTWESASAHVRAIHDRVSARYAHLETR